VLSFNCTSCACWDLRQEELEMAIDERARKYRCGCKDWSGETKRRNWWFPLYGKTRGERGLTQLVWGKRVPNFGQGTMKSLEKGKSYGRSLCLISWTGRKREEFEVWPKKKRVKKGRSCTSHANEKSWWKEKWKVRLRVYLPSDCGPLSKAVNWEKGYLSKNGLRE